MVCSANNPLKNTENVVFRQPPPDIKSCRFLNVMATANSSHMLCMICKQNNRTFIRLEDSCIRPQAHFIESCSAACIN